MAKLRKRRPRVGDILIFNNRNFPPNKYFTIIETTKSYFVSKGDVDRFNTYTTNLNNYDNLMNNHHYTILRRERAFTSIENLEKEVKVE